MTPRLITGKGITGLVKYVLGEGNKDRPLEAGQTSRVDWIGGTGFPGMDVRTPADVEMARKRMEFDALNGTSSGRPLERDAVHLILSFARGEQPTREMMEEAAHSALEALGMGNARAIFVAHNDEGQPHMHIILSRVNPENGKSYDLPFQQLTLSAWADQWELDHGGTINLSRVTNNELRAAIQGHDAGKVLDCMVLRTPTFTEKDLEKALGKTLKSELGRDEFRREILAHPNIVGLSEKPGGPVTRYSTKEAIEAERYAISAGDRLVKQDHHKVDASIVDAVMAQPAMKKITGEQRRAYARAVGPEGLVLIDGQAGTGKTAYTITAAREAYERSGFHVVGLAPTNKVAGELRESGFKDAQNINAALLALNSGREKIDRKTVLLVDEAAMVSTSHIAQLTTRAAEAGAKLILVGDDRQLDAIDRGGMFSVLKKEHGAAEISVVQRQLGKDDRRASELMARGEFGAALQIYDNLGAIRFTRSEKDAQAALVERWSIDTAKAPKKSRFVFAYTNADVDILNGALRKVREDRGELGPGREFQTNNGTLTIAEKDRVQFTAGDKKAGITNGDAGTVKSIDGAKITVRLDGKKDRFVEIDTEKFKGIRHGYAGTIYRGQGATLDQTYLMHSSHWRQSSGYVALTRHREKTAIFAATNSLNIGTSSRLEPWMSRTGGLAALPHEAFESAQRSYAKWADEKPELARKHDLADYVSFVQERTAEGKAAEAKRDALPRAGVEIGGAVAKEAPAMRPELVALAKQMARSEDRKAASSYYPQTPLEPLKVLTADELAVKFAPAITEHYGKEGVAEAQRKRVEPPDLGKTAMDIRMALRTADNAESFAEALAAKGSAIARASPEDVRANQASAKAGIKRNRTLTEGQLCVVTSHGYVYQLDTRLTNMSRAEIGHRLSGFDGAAVGSIAETKAAVVEAARDAWQVDRRNPRPRPASKIENTIWQAFQGDFATSLDKAGITIARATPEDKITIDAMRQADRVAQLADKPGSGFTLPKEVTAGSLVAVTNKGHVFALNPNEVNFQAVEERLAKAERAIGSISKTRDAKLAEPAIWAKRRKDGLDKRITRSKEDNFRRDVRAVTRKAGRALGDVRKGLGPRKALGLVGGIGAAVLGLFSFLGNMFSPPPPMNRQQLELRHRSRLEQADRIEIENKNEEHLTEINRAGSEQKPGAERNPTLVREAEPTRTQEQGVDRGRELELRWPPPR